MKFVRPLICASYLLSGCSGDDGAPDQHDAAQTVESGDASRADAGSADSGGALDAGTHDAATAELDGGAAAGACEPGSSQTEWASNCPTTVAPCMAGTWRDPGSTTNDPLQCESAHFAVHSPAGTITQQQCTNATSTLETLIWPAYFGAPVLFPEPYCNSATKYKASIVIRADSGLTGGGWGNGYMGMWIGPGATSDHWGLAHEFMHAVQAQTKGLDCGGAESNNFCGWFYESHANFMPHQLAEYRSDVHCSEMLVNAPHLYLGSTRDRYCNWQFMEFLKDKHCYSAVNQLWTNATKSDDPFSNLATTRGFDTAQLNDFLGEWALHNVTWDYKNPDGSDQGKVYRSKYGPVTDVSKPERRLRLTRLLPLAEQPKRYVVPTLQAPQRWGYNVVRLHPEAGADSVQVTFRGVTQDGANSDWRWGLVATDSTLSKARYSPLQRGADGTLNFCVTAGESLFLVVMGTPSVQQKIVWDQPYPTIYRYPYLVELSGAAPDGYQPGAASPSSKGIRWPNGGGWVASGATVASGAYVGPYAAVLSGNVGASARIDDLAIIDGAKVESGVVAGLTVLTSNFTVSGTAQVSVAWPYAPGFFERPQSASGNARLIGDLELRGANTNKASGTYCGLTEPATASNCTMDDVTVAPPFMWRP